MFTSTIYLIGLSLFKELFIFLTYMGLSIFFSLNFYFLTNSELITKSVVPLSNNISIVIPFCISILSNPIFTITSLNSSPSFTIFFFLSFLEIIFLLLSFIFLPSFSFYITLLFHTSNLFKGSCIAIFFCSFSL